MTTSEDRKIELSVATAKAITAGELVPSSNATEASELNQRFTGAGAIVPPYDPLSLHKMVENSTVIRPNIDAYVVNIALGGWRFEPTIDLDADDAPSQVALVMAQEALAMGEPKVPTDEDVHARMLVMRGEARMELAKLNAFFSNVGRSEGISFGEIRARSLQDKEETGNRYWEVVRAQDGEPIFINHLPARSMRAMALCKEMTSVMIAIQQTACSFVKVESRKRFRTYVQVVDGVESVYFKEFGDPRPMSASTGKFYQTVDELIEREPRAVPATEVIHDVVWASAAAPYGVPRWIGAAPLVRGARASEEINCRHFDNKGLPNGILTLEGGAFGTEAEEKVKDFFRERLVGRENFDRILILSVPPNVLSSTQGSTISNPALKFTDLTGALQKDGIFQEYEKQAERRTGSQFRIPNIFRGDSSDYNRATSDTAMDLTNAQVFSPERAKDDDLINLRLLPDLGIRYWRFVSGAAKEQEPKERLDMATKAAQFGFITANEARPIVAEALGRPLEKRDDDWAEQPYPLLLKQKAADTVKELMDVRSEMDRQAAAGFASSAEASQREGHDTEDDDEEVKAPSVQ